MIFHGTSPSFSISTCSLISKIPTQTSNKAMKLCTIVIRDMDLVSMVHNSSILAVKMCLNQLARRGDSFWYTGNAQSSCYSSSNAISAQAEKLAKDEATPVQVAAIAALITRLMGLRSTYKEIDALKVSVFLL